MSDEEQHADEAKQRQLDEQAWLHDDDDEAEGREQYYAGQYMAAVISHNQDNLQRGIEEDNFGNRLHGTASVEYTEEQRD